MSSTGLEVFVWEMQRERKRDRKTRKKKEKIPQPNCNHQLLKHRNPKHKNNKCHVFHHRRHKSLGAKLETKQRKGENDQTRGKRKKKKRKKKKKSVEQSYSIFLMRCSFADIGFYCGDFI